MLFNCGIFQVNLQHISNKTIFLQDALDQYERYNESPRHTPFFTSLVRSVVSDTRQQVILTDLELQVILQDFSTIQ